MTMDDPTTTLFRDPNKITLMVAANRQMAEQLLAHYGVLIQLDTGVKFISNQAEALDAIVHYPTGTPWCIVPDGLVDTNVRDTMRSWFGLPKTIPEALGVEQRGIAMRVWEMTPRT
jgi:hypothetical protein